MLDARYWIRGSVQGFSVQRFRVQDSEVNPERRTQNGERLSEGIQ